MLMNLLVAIISLRWLIHPLDAMQTNAWLVAHAPGLAMVPFWQLHMMPFMQSWGSRALSVPFLLGSLGWIWVMVREQRSWVFNIEPSRFSYNHGIWSTNPVWVPWMMIQDMRAHQSLWGKMMRFAHVEVDTGGRMFFCFGVPEHFAAEMLKMWEATGRSPGMRNSMSMSS